MAALVARSPRLQAALQAPDTPRRVLSVRFPPAECGEAAAVCQRCWQERCRRRSLLVGRGQRPGEAARRATVCGAIRSVLYPHQLAGIRWLFKAFCSGGGILADDPGLGKTLQIIGVLEALTRARLASSVLVVVPASLIKNWEVEIKRWLGRTKFRLDTVSACARTGAVQAPPDGASPRLAACAPPLHARAHASARVLPIGIPHH